MRRLVIAVLAISMLVGAGRRRSVNHPSRPATALPAATADAFSLPQGGVLTVAAPGVLANDTLNGATLAGFGASSGEEQVALGINTASARAGTVRLFGDGSFVYTPPASFTGSDTFRYVLANAGGRSSATVTIDVTAPSMNAANDSYTTPPDTPLSVPAPGVLTNDTLGGGRIVTFGKSGSETTAGASSASVQAGVVALRTDGGFSYTPPPPYDDGYGHVQPFSGVDTFYYVLQNGPTTSKGAVVIDVQNPVVGADFVVTTPGHYYAISGLTGENPVLELRRGATYTFQIDASLIHPFAILDAPPGSVTNNNITTGVLTFTVPAAAQNYRYRCTTHDFGNLIRTVP